MNILAISNNPARASFRQRAGGCLGTLRTNGIDCEVTKLPAGCLARRALFKRAQDFDGVFLHKKTLNFLDAMWLRRYARKIIYDFDDAIMYSDKHPETPSHKRQTSFERTVKLADMIITANPYLADHARRFNKNVEIVPTGLDINAYKPQANPKNDDKIRLVWIGSKSTLPYLAQIKNVLEEIGSRFDNIVLRIICDDFFDLQNMEVEKCWWSSETQAVDLVTSDIGLAPLPSNKFTRGKSGGFKLLQYAAAGLPVIASAGVNAKHVRENVSGLLAGAGSEWVENISRLLKDPQLRKRMGEAGKVDIQEFDLKVLGEQLVNLLKDCLNETTN